MSEKAVTSAPVSSLKVSVSWSQNWISLNHAAFWLVEASSRKAVSRLFWFAGASWATVFVRRCALSCPFRWHLWQVASLVGHLSRGCCPFPHRVHGLPRCFPLAAPGSLERLPSLRCSAFGLLRPGWYTASRF